MAFVEAAGNEAWKRESDLRGHVGVAVIERHGCLIPVVAETGQVLDGVQFIEVTQSMEGLSRVELTCLQSHTEHE